VPRRWQSEPGVSGGRRDRQADEQVGPAGPARNGHILLSFHVQSSFRWHPRFGQALFSKRLHRGPGGERSLMCLLPDNTWAPVPEWMTSREACARCQLAEVPEVSLSALLQLAAALEALPLAGHSSTICSEMESVEEAGEDETNTGQRQLESPAARASVGGANSLGRTAGADQASASRRTSATAQVTRRRRRGGER
jgi:hypothetical protein